MTESVEEYTKILDEDINAGQQIRLVISVFKGDTYIHFRKYFLSFEGDWIPSNDGTSIKASMHVLANLFDGLLEVLSNSEVSSLRYKYLGK